MLHPIFFTSGATPGVEIFDQAAAEPKVVRTQIIKDYLNVPSWMGIALPGQPELQVRVSRPSAPCPGRSASRTAALPDVSS